MKEITDIKNNPIDFAKKLKDAQTDIEKINDILSNSSTFYHRADYLYEKLNSNVDYVPYVISTKIAKGMVGNISFKNLPYYQKRRVFAMFKDAITLYISKELTEKMLGEKNDKRS